MKYIDALKLRANNLTGVVTDILRDNNGKPRNVAVKNSSYDHPYHNNQFYFFNMPSNSPFKFEDLIIGDSVILSVDVYVQDNSYLSVYALGIERTQKVYYTQDPKLSDKLLSEVFELK